MQQADATGAQLNIDPKKMVSAFGYFDSLGAEGGTSVNRFLENLAGTTPQKRKALKASGMDFWQKNKDGTTTLKPIEDVFDIVRNHFKRIKSDKAKISLSHKLFGEEGGRIGSLLSAKTESFKDFDARVQGATGAATKLAIEMEGLGASFAQFKNTLFSKADTQFAPVRNGLTGMTNTVTSGIDAGYLPQMLLGGAGLVAASRLAYKTYKGGKAGATYMDSALGGLGAQKVFVTNWPKGMLGPGEDLKQKRKNGADGGNGGIGASTASKGKLNHPEF